MLVRYGRLPVVAVVFLAVGLLMGAALMPVAAQQMSGVDGQVAVRSDGAVFLISGGQRRWVATVMITDAEINAYPEAEPIFSGLAPLPPQAPGPAPAASPAPSGPAAVPAAAPTSVPTPAAAPPPASAPAAGGPVPVEIDIDGSPKFEAGDVIRAAVKTSVGAACDLTARFPDGSEVPQPGTAADARGHCSFSIDIPSTAQVGAGQLRATVRVGGQTGQGELPFEVVPNS